MDISKLPCIAHITYQKKYQHFVVVYEMNKAKKEIILMDPAKGKVILPFAEFTMLSSGYFLYLSPNKILPSITLPPPSLLLDKTKSFPTKLTKK